VFVRTAYLGQVISGCVPYLFLSKYFEVVVYYA
jgi:hypothetical protein